MSVKKGSLADDPAHAAALEKFKAVDTGRQRDANDAIAILERRAQSATKEIELPGGDIIKIRNRLPRTEFAECARLFGQIAERHAAGDTEGSEAASNALVGHILYMEDMTPDEIAAWIEANPQSVSDIDAEEIVLEFRRMRREELARLKRIADFREE
jgi:hypothetical protein